jgi:replicative DNA helicase
MNPIPDRLPPHSLEAEQGVLGCCLLSPAECVSAAQERIKDPLAFYDLRHQTIWQALLALDTAKTGVDLITVRQWLQDHGQLEGIGGIAYLTSLVDGTPTAANLPFYLDILLQKQVLRKMLATCAKVTADIFARADSGDVEVLMDAVEKDLQAVGQLREVGVEYDGKTLAQLGLDYLETATRAKGLNMGIPTGFAYFDKMTGGLHPGEMVVWAGRPSTGKTSFLKSVLENVCVRDKVPCGFFSLEMTARQVAVHLKFQLAEKDFQMLRTGMWKDEDLQSVLMGAPKLAVSPLYVDDTSGLSMPQIRSKARRWVKQHGVKLIAIDYLQMIKPVKRLNSREQEVSEMSNAIKALAKELQVPVVVLAQLNRDIDKERLGGGGDSYQRKPQLSDLRESGQIEQDSDTVMILYQPKLREVKDDKEGGSYGYDEAGHVAELTDDWRAKMGVETPDWAGGCKRINACLCKQREGPQGDVELLFVKGCMKFVDYLRPGSRAGNYIRKPKAVEMPTEEEMGDWRDK